MRVRVRPGACFLLLLVTFRSLVIATKAVLLNLLSVGAAYGLLVLVFQHRWAEGLLGFHSNGAITSWLPLFMFVILFGLSMDYHVFILSRIKELRDAGMSTEDAIANGIKRTAGDGHERRDRDGRRVRDLRQPPHARHQADGLRPRGGDPDRRHIVRGVLLPAVMKLLGEWNWYLPRWLEWLPRFEAEAAPGSAASAGPAASASGSPLRHTRRSDYPRRRGLDEARASRAARGAAGRAAGAGGRRPSELPPLRPGVPHRRGLRRRRRGRRRRLGGRAGRGARARPRRPRRAAARHRRLRGRRAAAGPRSRPRDRARLEPRAPPSTGR